MITRVEYKPGEIVSIYRDCKNELNYEGEAILIEKVKVGHSFIRPDEKLYTKLEDKSIDEKNKHIPLTKGEKHNNNLYNQLVTYFEGYTIDGELYINKDLQRFGKLLVQQLNTSLDNPSSVLETISKYRFTCRNKVDETKTFFNKFTDEQIFRFIQQRYMKNWSSTIYREEKWLVEFIPDQYSIETKSCLYNSAFRTTRYLAKIICICPNEDAQDCDIVLHTTNERGVSNKDKRLMRKKKGKKKNPNKQKEEEPDFDSFEPTDSEIEKIQRLFKL